MEYIQSHQIDVSLLLALIHQKVADVKGVDSVLKKVGKIIIY